MKATTSSLILVLLLLPGTSFTENYKVVNKNTGKITEGRLLREDETTIYLEIKGVQVNFKKSLLDLEKMNALNEKKENQENALHPMPQTATNEKQPLQKKTFTNEDIK